MVAFVGAGDQQNVGRGRYQLHHRCVSDWSDPIEETGETRYESKASSIQSNQKDAEKGKNFQIFFS